METALTFIKESLADLNQHLEKKKIRLTPEIQKYLQDHLEALQKKIAQNQAVQHKDLAFLTYLKEWVQLPEEYRRQYPDIDFMLSSDEMKEAKKRDINLEQWLDLLHVAQVEKEDQKWIDERFLFPGKGKIVSKASLNLGGRTELMKIPSGLFINGYFILRHCSNLKCVPPDVYVREQLSLGCCTSLVSISSGLHVEGNLHLHDCISLTGLPSDVSIGGDVCLSKDFQVRLKEDLERLKKEGRIRGEIKYQS